MILPFIILFFVFGSVIGSFLNVVIYRYNTKNIVLGRSICMSCQSKLAWYDLLPLLSFFLLKGRCKTCKVKISRQYPIVEATTGVMFALLFYKFQYLFFTDLRLFVLSYVYYAVLFSVLLVISVYDLRHKIIPDGLVFIFDLLALISVFLFSGYVFDIHTPNILDIGAGFVLALPFAFIWLVSRGAWMGLGDAKLELGLGWLLGISLGLSALAVSFWMGAIVGILLILISKIYAGLSSGHHSLKSELPFAPFLALGSFVIFIFGFHVFPLITLF